MPFFRRRKKDKYVLAHEDLNRKIEKLNKDMKQQMVYDSQFASSDFEKKLVRQSIKHIEQLE